MIKIHDSFFRGKVSCRTGYYLVYPWPAILYFSSKLNHNVQICEVSFNPRLPVRFRNRVAESFFTFKNIAAMYTKAIPLQTVSYGNFLHSSRTLNGHPLFICNPIELGYAWVSLSNPVHMQDSSIVTGRVLKDQTISFWIYVYS